MHIEKGVPPRPVQIQTVGGELGENSSWHGSCYWNSPWIRQLCRRCLNTGAFIYGRRVPILTPRLVLPAGGFFVAPQEEPDGAWLGLAFGSPTAPAPSRSAGASPGFAALGRG